MLQQAAAGRFLGYARGYGGMRQPGVGDFTYNFTPCKGAKRFGDEHRNRCLGHRLAFLTTKSYTTRETFQNATPHQPKLGRGTAHQDTDRGQPGVCTFMLPGLSRPSLLPFMEGGRQGYGGMLCRAATRPSTVYGGMPEELFGSPISTLTPTYIRNPATKNPRTELSCKGKCNRTVV
jgi:hypothetical protein